MASRTRRGSTQAAPQNVVPPEVPPMTRNDWFIVGGLTLLHLLTFIGKPAHIDDTLYLETAKGILQEPLHPLMNSINWEWFSRPIYKFAVNPPLYNYQQALVVKLFGWNLPMLHVLSAGYVFIAALAVSWLARRFTPWPTVTLLLFMLSPTFMPQTNMMLDVPGMALVAAAVALWVRAVDRGSMLGYGGAALVAAAAILTKYNCMIVLPLMAVYSVLRGRWMSLPFLLIPLLFLGGWNMWNIATFPEKRSHLDIANSRFSGDKQTIPVSIRGAWQGTILSLMSWGGAFIFLPAWAVWSWMRGRLRLALLVAVPCLMLFLLEAVIAFGSQMPGDSTWQSMARTAAKMGGFDSLYRGNFPAWTMPHWLEHLAFVGNAILMAAMVMTLVFSSWRLFWQRWRDGTIRDDLFIAAWVLGMSLFNGLFAPHHAPRYYFNGYPAVPILLVRAASRLRRRDDKAESGDDARSQKPRRDAADSESTANSETPVSRPGKLVWASVAMQGVVALVLTGSDYTFAAASRDFVDRLAALPEVQQLTAERPLIYCAHWGFQYYAQQHENFHVVDSLSDPPPPVGGLVAIVMDTGWGEIPRWLKQGALGREALDLSAKGSMRNRRTGKFDLPYDVKFEVVERWDVPHPWPLQTIDLERRFLLYSPRHYHNRIPYGRSRGRSHEMLLVRRVR